MFGNVGGLRIGSREREALSEGVSEGAGDHRDAHETREPQQQDAAAPAVTPRGETLQHVGLSGAERGTGVGVDIVSMFTEGRRAAARGSAILWLREIHRLEARGQRTLASELMSEIAKEDRNLRVITSSTASLFDSVAAGRFDAQLFYRLNTIHIIVPGNHR